MMVFHMLKILKYAGVRLVIPKIIMNYVAIKHSSIALKKYQRTNRYKY